MTDIAAALRTFYAAPSWAYFEEVRNATGYVKQDRYADGVAMSLWPSRGMEVHGIEIKRSRNDWLKELKNPQKAEAIYKYCDRWWLAVSDKNIAKIDEIPRTWGLYVLNDGKLKVLKQAPVLKPKALDRGFIASILRRQCEQLQKMLNDRIEPEVEARVEKRLEQAKTHWEHMTESKAMMEKRAFEDLKVAVERFEEASGVKIGVSWEANRIGQVVREVLAVKDVSRQLQHVRRTVEGIAKQLAAIPSE